MNQINCVSVCADPRVAGSSSSRGNQINRVSSSVVAGKTQCSYVADPRVTCLSPSNVIHINLVSSCVVAGNIHCRKADPRVAGWSLGKLNR